MKTHNLPAHMAELRRKIERHAREFGLDFFDTIFQIVDFEEMNEIASYSGFPNRYPHWRFGMNYDQMRKKRSYGLATIYEMVINTDPAYAYLLDCNNLTQQKMVMAHVYGHVDFFKNNYMFAHTNRKMMDEMANHATRVRKHIDKYGIERVESFIDTCLSLERLIDPDALYTIPEKEPKEDDDPNSNNVARFKVEREYMNSYVNPREYLDKQKEQMEAKKKEKKKIPAEPKKDVLEFLIKHAQLSSWQRSIIDMIREESYYFSPQIQTKILNEGWACFCHSKIMTKAMEQSELMDYADCHSGVTSMIPGQLNPYALGLALLKDIEERWNKGRHGGEYDSCSDMGRKRTWNTGENKGLEKIFEVRRLYNDITFIDEFMTREFCEEQKLFTYSRHKTKDGAEWRIDSKQFSEVKEKFLSQLINFGLPFIYLTDSNDHNRAELLLHHKWEGIPLDLSYAIKTIRNLEKIWGRPVNVETFNGERWYRLRSDSQKITHQEMPEEELSWKY